MEMDRATFGFLAFGMEAVYVFVLLLGGLVAFLGWAFFHLIQAVRRVFGRRRGRRNLRERASAWRALAAELGLEYSPEDPTLIQAQPHQLFRDIQLYMPKRLRQASNKVRGVYRGRECLCFDLPLGFVPETGLLYGGTRILVATPVDFEPLIIQPESDSTLERFDAAVGAGPELPGDIDFELDEFNRRYYVQCRDRKFAYDVLHPRAIELLLRNGDFYVEARGSTLLVAPARPLMSVPSEVRAMLDFACDFVDLLPQYLQQSPDALGQRAPEHRADVEADPHDDRTD